MVELAMFINAHHSPVFFDDAAGNVNVTVVPPRVVKIVPKSSDVMV